MLQDQVSNPGPLTYESDALPIALRGPASLKGHEIMLAFCHSSNNRKTNSVNPAVNGYLFESKKDEGVKGEGLAPSSISCVQSNPHCPLGY